VISGIVCCVNGVIVFSDINVVEGAEQPTSLIGVPGMTLYS
jgi:hypothetical protein